MEQVQKDKLVANIKASPKMLSVQVIAGVSGVASAVLGWFLQLNPAAQQQLLQGVLGHWAWGITLLPIITGTLAWYARVHPQADLTPAEAESKSATVGPAEIAAGTKAAVDEAPGLPPVDVASSADVDPVHRY